MYDPIALKPADLDPRDGVAPQLPQSGLKSIIDLMRVATPFAAAFGALFVGLMLLYTMNAEPTFSSYGKLLIDPGRADALIQDENKRPESMSTSDARIDSEVEVLKSDRLAYAVIDKLNLLDVTEFQENDDPLSWVLGLFRPVAEVVISGKENAPQMRYAAAVFANRLQVRRVGTSLILELSFRSNDPERAARITNTLMELYIESEVTIQADSARIGGDWLKSRLDELRAQSYDAMREVERFKTLGEATPLGEAQVKLAELESISNTYRRMYETFLEKLTGTIQKISYPVADARIVAAAAIPLTRSHPKTTLLVAFAALLGGATGFGVALARMSADRRVTSRHHLKLGASAELLGVVSRQPWRRNMLRPSRKLLDLTAHGVNSAFADEIRTIKTSITAATLGRRARCIGVTSLDDADGASTVAANLAFVHAAGGARTLLVDANQRHPTISHVFSPDRESGLFDTLDEHALVQDSVVDGPSSQLWIMPLGRGAPNAALGDRIGTERSDRLWDDLRADYEVILFDLPAMSASSDPRAIAPFLDGVVIVASANASIDQISDAVTFLREARASVIGVVLNKVAAAKKKSLLVFQ